MITIVDYQTGNSGSIANMLKHIGADAKISSERDDIEKATKLILSGVGAFDSGMENLHKLNIIPLLNKKVLQDKIPVLGICLGMQLMTRWSEEGSMAGLGWIDAETIKFNFASKGKKLRVPHVGWNSVHPVKYSDLFLFIDGELRYYFVHSYHVACRRKEDIFATTNYGIDFVSSFKKDNILGVQFHPEKSHKFGMHFLRNFSDH